MVPTTERALSQPSTARGASALGPVSRPARDVAVLVVVLAVVVMLVRARAGVEYPLPVSVGNATIENGAEVLADAEEHLQELAESQGGRIAEEAACYFWRPMGATQGAVATEMLSALGSLLPDMDGAVAVDIVLCGPAELTSAVDLPGMAQEPWVPAIVGYYPGSSATTTRGEVKQILPVPLPVLSAMGGAQADTLLEADGRSPDEDVLENPTWIEVEGTGEGSGLGLPPEMSLPEIPDIPDIENLPDMDDLPDPDDVGGATP